MRIKFSDLTITAKIKLGFFISSIITVAISVCGIYYLNNAKSNIDRIYKENFLPVTKISSVLVLSEKMRSIMRDSIRWNDEEHIQDKIQTRKDIWDEISTNLTDYENLIVSEDDRKLYDEFVGVRNEYLTAIESVEKEAAQNNDEEAYRLIDVDSAMISNQYRESLQSFIDMRDVSGEDSLLGAIAKNSKIALIIMIILASIGVALSLFFILILTKIFQGITDKVLSSIYAVSQKSNDFMKSNEALSNRTSEQASSIEETVATIEEITSQVKNNLSETETSVKLSKDTLVTSDDGFKLYRKVEEQMNEIYNSGQKITGIISMVNEIAFQTNILAINAAIEAAKGGEAGKGFAVVAIEVRSLAQRTVVAAKKIQDLLNINISQIENGMKYVKESSQKFSIINENINKLSSINERIALASKEQHTGVEQLYTAVSHIDKATQENAGLSEEISNSSKAMVETAETCKDFIMKTFVGNTNDATLELSVKENEEELTYD